MTELSDNNGILLNHYTIKPVRVKNVVYGLDIRDHNHLEEKWNILVTIIIMCQKLVCFLVPLIQGKEQCS